MDFYKTRKEIVGVILFGSYGSELYSEDSDIDFGIVYDEDKIALFPELDIEDKMSKILGTDAIDVVNLNKAPIILRYNAVANGRILYEANADRISDFLEETYRYYCDYKHDYLECCSDYDYSLNQSYGHGG